MGRGAVLKIYIAGKWSSRDYLTTKADQLRARGHDVVARWLSPTLDVELGEWAKLPPHVAVTTASLDLDDIDEAELLILDTLDESNTGGREVEFGYAIGTGKIVATVGPVRNGFHRLAHNFETWDQVLVELTSVRSIL